MKKGFLFSLFVITALSLILFTFKMRVEFQEEKRANIYKERVEQMNLFVEDVERDIERSLYVATFRAFLGLDEYIHTYHEYIPNVTKFMPEVILNGTLNGSQLNITNSSTFGEWIGRINLLAIRYNLNMTFNDIDIQVAQFTPWLIGVTFKSNVSITEINGVVGWDFLLSETSVLDISETNFPDPLYFVESINNYKDNTGLGTGQPILNSIQKSPYGKFWSNDSGVINASILSDHIQNQYYVANNNSPSYIMRLEGNTNCLLPGATCFKYGIESFVNVYDDINLWDYSISGTQTCATDFQFFTTNCNELHNIVNVSTLLFVDDAHLNFYNLTAINST